MPPELTRAGLHDMAAKVAAEMGWEPDPAVDPDDSYFARIRSMDGIAVCLNATRVPGMLHCTGSYPRSNYGIPRGQHGSINVSWARGTHAIAGDILRRLVPTVAATTARMRAFDEQEAADTAARLALVDKLRALLLPDQTYMVSHCQSDTRSKITVKLPGGAYHNGGDIDLLHDGRDVTFDRFRVTAEQAVRMVAAITGQA
jgi:hypothetical protein